jgi:hypothetical protein
MKAFFSLFSLGAHLRCRGGFSLSLLALAADHTQNKGRLCAREQRWSPTLAVCDFLTFPTEAGRLRKDERRAAQSNGLSFCGPHQFTKRFKFFVHPPQASGCAGYLDVSFTRPTKAFFYESSAAFFKESLLFLRGGLRNSLFSRFVRIITPPPGGISLPRPPLRFFPCPSRGWQSSAKRIKTQVSLFSKYTHNQDQNNSSLFSKTQNNSQ